MILARAVEPPAQGALRVAQNPVPEDIRVSSGGVRGMWSRHKLLTKHERLLRLGNHLVKRTFIETISRLVSQEA